MRSPAPEAHVLVLGVQVTWAALVPLVVEAAFLAWYLRSARRCGQRQRPWPLKRTLFFVAGTLVAAYTVEGGIAHYSRSNFTLNVVRCLLLVNVVPPLLCLGSPITLALRSSSRQAGERFLAWLESPRVRAVGHPAVMFVVAMAGLYAYFLTPLYRLSEAHAALGAAMNLYLLVVGCLLWWPIVARDVTARPLNWVRRFALVFAAVPLNIALGAAISSLGRPLYPAANTLADTETGGDVFWELSVVYTVLVLALLFVSWAFEEERRAMWADVELDAARTAEHAGRPEVS